MAGLGPDWRAITSFGSNFSRIGQLHLFPDVIRNLLSKDHGPFTRDHNASSAIRRDAACRDRLGLCHEGRSVAGKLDSERGCPECWKQRAEHGRPHQSRRRKGESLRFKFRVPVNARYLVQDRWRVHAQTGEHCLRATPKVSPRPQYLKRTLSDGHFPPLVSPQFCPSFGSGNKLLIIC